MALLSDAVAIRSRPGDGIQSAHLTARPRPQQTRTCDHRHDRLVRALIECWRPRIVYLAFGLIGDSLHPRSRVATKNPRAARNRGACPTPPRPASEERQGSKEDRQRNLWQGNEDHLSIPLPLIPLPNQMGHRQDATDLTTASRPRNFCAQLFYPITVAVTWHEELSNHCPKTLSSAQCARRCYRMQRRSVTTRRRHPIRAS
jgi:hypothetical protein